MHLTPVEASVLWVLVVKTLGAYDPSRRRVGRRDVRLSEQDIATDTGWAKQRVHEALHRLDSKGIITILDAGKGQRASRIALCRDPRRLEPARASRRPEVPEEAAAPVDLGAALAGITDSRLRAVMERRAARGVVERESVPRSLGEDAS
jgi:hypothetical protein